MEAMPCPLGGEVHGLIINQIHIHPYDAAEDSFWMCVLDENNDVKGTCVYYQGKFAKIVPDEPKELPKTLEELRNLLDKFYNSNVHTTPDNFLKNEGYETK